MLHTVSEGTELAVRLVTGGVNAVKAFEIAVFRLLDVDGEGACQRDDLRELLSLGIVVWLDLCHCSLLS